MKECHCLHGGEFWVLRKIGIFRIGDRNLLNNLYCAEEVNHKTQRKMHISSQRITDRCPSLRGTHSLFQEQMATFFGSYGYDSHTQLAQVVW